MDHDESERMRGSIETQSMGEEGIRGENTDDDGEAEREGMATQENSDYVEAPLEEGMAMPAGEEDISPTKHGVPQEDTTDVHR